MTPVSFVKSTESNIASLVSYDFGVLCLPAEEFEFGILLQDFEIMRCLPMDHTRFA